MPTAYVKKLASKHGISVSDAEAKWEKAKSAAKKEGHAKDYGYITSIFKKMMHEASAHYIAASVVRRLKESARKWEDDFFTTLCLLSGRAFQEGDNLAIRGHFRSSEREIRSGVSFIRDPSEDDTRIYRMTYWTGSENVTPQDILPEVVRYVTAAAKRMRLKMYDTPAEIPAEQRGIAVVFNRYKHCIDIVTKNEGDAA